MKTNFTHTQIMAMLPTFVQGALEPEEMLAIDAYLIEHYELRGWLYQVEQMMASFVSAPSFTALSNLPKATLMARVQADLEERRRAA
ncbi:MAG: hypothetical protein HC875_16355 [Anaerolineales bacterium]|nr:hypothetical protein [Anaerolineales bacterium]